MVNYTKSRMIELVSDYDTTWDVYYNYFLVSEDPLTLDCFNFPVASFCRMSTEELVETLLYLPTTEGLMAMSYINPNLSVSVSPYFFIAYDSGNVNSIPI